MITSKTKINVIIGDPVEHSLSPQIHNGVYKAMGMDSEFVFVAARVTPDNLKQTIEGIRGLGINGITVTIPHKTTVMELLDEIDTTAKEIGAVNTIVCKNNKLTGYNTDYLGILEPLKRVIKEDAKTVSILGAGGAAHAAAFAAKLLGLRITIFNRTPQHAKNLSEKFNCNFSSLDDLRLLKKSDVIINTTSVGLNSDESPLKENIFSSKQIVFDVIYTPFETTFLKQAKENGATIVHGIEMLLHQAIPQFELFTGIKPNEKIIREILEEII